MEIVETGALHQGSPEFTDTHTHLYAGEFKDDLETVISRALLNGVPNLFLPAIDSEYHEQMIRVVKRYPGNCHAMMGLHPTSVKGNYRDELALVAGHLADPEVTYYAIGEVGIDLYWDRTFEAEQTIAFQDQLDLALKYDLPVVIHTRNSMDLALGILAGRHDDRLRGVFHCFSGNTEQATQAIGLGFLLGIGGVLTYKNSGLQTVVENTPAQYLLLETDAPWLTPVPHRGKRNESSYIPLIAQKMAEIKHMSLQEVAEITTANALKLFGIG
ncbi:MAG: TatD family hydrolase [Bacteroidota bacterium]